MTEIKTKIWKTVGTFLNFEEADKKRNELKNKHEAVKIKRGGTGGEIFRIKVWDSPPPEIKKSNRRSRKNENKKIRTGQK